MLEITKIRLFLLVEVLLFAGAALIHLGLLVSGYEHAQARIAEGVIAAVLFLGLVISLIKPRAFCRG